MKTTMVLGAAISLGLGMVPSSAMAASLGQVAAIPQAGGNTTIQESNSPTATRTFFSETNPAGIEMTPAMTALLGPKVRHIVAHGGVVTSMRITHAFFQGNGATGELRPISQQQYDALSPSNASNMFSRNMQIPAVGSHVQLKATPFAHFRALYAAPLIIHPDASVSNHHYINGDELTEVVTTVSDASSHVEYYLSGGFSWSQGNPYIDDDTDYMGIGWWPQKGQLPGNQGAYACAYCSYNDAWYNESVSNPDYGLGHGASMSFPQEWNTGIKYDPNSRTGYELWAPNYSGCIYTVIESSQVPNDENIGNLQETYFHTTSGVSYSLGVTYGSPSLTISPTTCESPYYSDLASWDY
ncbi:hypothetical protein CO251_11060 [Sulfobacillus sp. hq2]|nr:hypothetical protein CO251_11060 [Sulfobacillus sp. hq2]